MHSDSWQLLSIPLSILSVALQAAGVASPRWIWMDNGDAHVGLGLFYRIGLDRDDNDVIPTEMTKVVIDSDKTLDTDHWLAMAILEIISGGFVILLIPLIVYHYRLFKADNNNTIWCIRRILVLLAALSWMTNAAGLLVFIIYHGDILTKGPDINSKSFSWSGLMCAGALMVNVAIHYIIITRFDDTFRDIPSGGDPNINQFPSTQSGLMSRYYQSDVNNAHNIAAKASVDGFSNGQPPLTQMGNGFLDGGEHINRYYIHDDGRRFSNLSQPQVSSNMANLQNDRTFSKSTDALNSRAQGYNSNNLVQLNNTYQPFSYYQGISGNFPRKKETEVVGRAVTTSLEHHIDRTDQYDNGGGRQFDQEFVFNREDLDQTQIKGGFVRETEFVRNVRRQSGDFLVTAKHGLDRDPYRQQHKYMSHTKGQAMEDDNRGQRLVLSPANFTEGNVKYNPGYMYRPYSEQTY